MNFCTECGWKIEQNSKFCGECGFQLNPVPTDKQSASSQNSNLPYRREFQVLIEHLLQNLEYWNISIARPKNSLPLYIQVSEETGGWLLEASSENYTNPPISNAQIAQLLELGFSQPNDDVCLNYWRREANFESAVEILVDTFFDVFHFNYSEAIRGTTPEVDLNKYLKKNFKDSLTVFRVIK